MDHSFLRCSQTLDTCFDLLGIVSQSPNPTEPAASQASGTRLQGDQHHYTCHRSSVSFAPGLDPAPLPPSQHNTYVQASCLSVRFRGLEEARTRLDYLQGNQRAMGVKCLASA